MLSSLHLARFVTRRPAVVVFFWVVAALAVGLIAPDLTRLAAEGQSRVLGDEVESRKAAEIIARVWPEQSNAAVAVAAVHRPGGLTAGDREFVARLSDAYRKAGQPAPLLRVLSPTSDPELADRLNSRDGTLALIVLPLSTPFVSPRTHEAVATLKTVPDDPALARPEGLEVRWTGDAVIGQDYMRGVQTSLDRAAIVTVVLLLIVLLAVYRSLWLALVPIVTIAISLVISRGLLAWLNLAGWEISSLVELFLVVVLFGSGTDFCLFISWRFAEAWDPADPAGAMEATLRRSSLALLTSAGTVIVGLSLMSTTKFKLFSSTGPSVALGLVLSLAATLSLTPALLVVLARIKPGSFSGMTAPSSGLWEKIGKVAMARPLLSWVSALLLMAPLTFFGFQSHVVQDLLTELPASTPSAGAYNLIATKFDPGFLAPVNVVLETEGDFRTSEGLALIDDLSRYISRQRDITEVRSATQPLGSTKRLDPARIDSRLKEIRNGFGQMATGAGELRKGLAEAAMKLRAAIWLEDRTGLSVLAPPTRRGTADKMPDPGRRDSAERAKSVTGEVAGTNKVVDPRKAQVDELLRAAEGADRIAEGAGRGSKELLTILEDPVGRRALDQLLLDQGTVNDHPEIRRSFKVYLTPDGHKARLDLAQTERVFSVGALDGVDTLRRKVHEFFDGRKGPHVTALVTGANADSADVRMLTRSDQVQSWFVIPLGVFLVLLVALRDPLACVNLVATMMLTYVFALGATHLVFVVGLGAEGIDWKVPYFLFVLLVAVGVDYNVFLMARLHEESSTLGLRAGIVKAIGQTGGLITSAAAITACSFASFMVSPLSSLRQLGFALAVGIAVDALLVRPLLVPSGHWLLARLRKSHDSGDPDLDLESGSGETAAIPARVANIPQRFAGVMD